MAVLYSSGIKLFVERQPEDLSDLGEDVAPFTTDGRARAFEPRRILGVDVLVGEAGIQQGGNQVRARLMWNRDGNGYQLVAPLGMTTDELIEVFRSIEATGDA